MVRERENVGEGRGGGEGKGRGEEGRGGGVFQILTLKFIHVHIHNDSTANLLTTLASEFLKPYLSITNTLQEGMIFIMYMLQTDWEIDQLANRPPVNKLANQFVQPSLDHKLCFNKKESWYYHIRWFHLGTNIWRSLVPRPCFSIDDILYSTK